MEGRLWQKLGRQGRRGGAEGDRRPPTDTPMTASHPIDIPPPPPATGRGGGAGPRSTVPVDAAAAQRAVADAMWRTTCERLLPSQEEVDAACAAEPAATWGFYLLPGGYGGYGYAAGPPAGSWSPPASYDAYDLGVAVRRTSRPTSSSSSSASSSPSPSRSPPPHGRKATRRSKRGGRRGGAAVRARR